MKKGLIIFLLLCFYSMNGFAQSVHTVDSIETAYHNCLDKGTFMSDCSRKFHTQMDSMLNVAYRNLMQTCNEIEKANLIAEQKQWLIKRNVCFRKSLAKSGKELKEESITPQDNEMFRIDNDAYFVKKRVVQLLKAINKDYSKNSKHKR